MKIIGIAGTNGSGKDSLGEILANDYGWLFVSITNILRDEAKKRNLPIERPTLWTISAEWRRQNGLGVLIDKAVSLFDGSKYKGLAIASLRNPGEVNRVHELGGKVVWVDADPKVRYKRTEARARSLEDQKTFEEFLAEQEAEMQQGDDQATLSLSGVKAKADIFIENNGTLEEFKQTIKQTLKLER